MTSDQSCPLCGEKIISSIDKKGYIFCNNIKCSIAYTRIKLEYIKLMESQIARIKQEAKQEVFDDLDSNSTDVSDHGGNSIRRYVEFKHSVYKKIKKKHGVE